MITSKQFSLNWRDVANGLLLAVIAAVTPVIGQSIETGSFVFNITDIWHAAIAGAWSYLVYRFFKPAAQVKPVE